MPKNTAYTAAEGRDALNRLMEEVGSQSLTVLDRQPLNHEKTRWLLPLRVSDGRVVCVIEDEGVAGWMDLQSKGIMGMWTWQHNPNRPLWDVGDDHATLSSSPRSRSNATCFRHGRRAGERVGDQGGRQDGAFREAGSSPGQRVFPRIQLADLAVARHRR